MSKSDKTKKSKKHQNKFKAKVKEAKKYQKEHPNESWVDCIKHVWKK